GRTSQGGTVALGDSLIANRGLTGPEGFRAQAVQGPELTTPRPYGSAHFGPGLGHGYQLRRDTREERIDKSPVGSKRGQNIVENRRGGRSAPTTVNSSVRTPASRHSYRVCNNGAGPLESTCRSTSALVQTMPSFVSTLATWQHSRPT